jgi:hypothetical protein
MLGLREPVRRGSHPGWGASKDVEGSDNGYAQDRYQEAEQGACREPGQGQLKAPADGRRARRVEGFAEQPVAARVPPDGGERQGRRVENEALEDDRDRQAAAPLCITATRDVAGSRLWLQQCRIGSAGGSHQVWRPVNVIDSGFRVYKNVANGLVMTLVGDSNGAPLQIRSLGSGTGANKNFKLVHTAP